MYPILRERMVAMAHRRITATGPLLLFVLAAFFPAQRALPAAPATETDPAWVGSATCRGCHEAEYDAWRGSHHDLAMQEASPQTVLGNFDDAEFEYAGLTSRFFREGAAFRVQTEGSDGKLAQYDVAYVFGVYPLQQYLIAFPDGRLQALSIAWDTRPEAAGGQRWFHLYPDDEIKAGDPLHWTGPYQNWNLQCADCHSTRLQKNYDPKSGEYATTWSEIDVACEACHGPGAQHVSLVRAGKVTDVPAAGFPVALGERGTWFWPENEAIAQRREPLDRSRQVEACGRCHARRGVLGSYVHGKPLADTHRVSLLRDPLYHVDGQILDEVYVYGSFRQSKMYQAGVVCSNCHEPHKATLRAPGNAVCTQCHKPASYDTTEHHHHPAESAGAACANCHMPARTYMVVDPRRDHSMRIPRPDLSVALGTPNACNGCHADQNAEWAVNRLRDWGLRPGRSASHPARSLSLLRRGDRRGVPGLLALANLPETPGIWRATLLVELGDFADSDVFELALSSIGDADPLLRSAAVEVLAQLPPEPRFRYLVPLLDDPALAVRVEVARALADVPTERLPPERASQLVALFGEYQSVLERNSDMPDVLLQQGLFYAARRNWEAAEQAYRAALDKNPELLSAWLNIADLYRQQNREEEGRAALLQASAVAPREGIAWHALGLLEVRAGNRELALDYLGKAATLESEGTRLRYVYGIALYDNGETRKALDVLKPLLRETPEDPDLLIALATYSKAAGQRSEALRYADRLRELLPDDPRIQQFYDSL